MRASTAAMLALTALLFVFYAPILAGKVMVDRDLFRLFIPDAHFLRTSLLSLEWPLWNPHQRLGQPFAATLYSQVYYPLHVILVLLLAPAAALSVQIIVHVTLLAVGAYAACRAFGLDRVPSWVAAGAAGFTPLLSQMTSQLNILSAIAWTGFQLVALRQLSLAPSPRTFALATLSFAASITCGSPEMLLLQLALGALLVVLHQPRRNRLLAALTPVAASLMTLVVLLPAAELALRSTRTTAMADATSWSASFLDLGSIAVLSPRGVPRADFLPTTTMGVSVVFLAALALTNLRRTRAAWPFAIAASALLILSLGRHFAPSVLLLGLPPLSLFRYPSRYLVGAAFCIAVLAGFGAQSLAGLHHRRIAWAFAGVVGVQLLVLVAGAVPAQIFWAVIFTLAVAAAAYLRSVTLLAAICAIELVAARFYLSAPGWLPISRVDHPSAMAPKIDRSEGARVSIDLAGFAADRLVENSRDALIPLRWVEEGLEAFEGYGAPEPKLFTQLTEQFTLPRTLYDLASVRTFVRAGPPPFERLTPVPATEGLPRIYLSTSALPRAFVVTAARITTDAEAARLLSQSGWDPTAVVLVSSGAPVENAPRCESTVLRTVLSPREQHYDTVACADGQLFISDSFFPGWEATVDGAPAPIVRANLLFRAVRVTAGAHHVVMRYAPWTSRVGAIVSLLSVALALLAVGWPSRRRVVGEAAGDPP